MTAPIIGWGRARSDHDTRHHAIVSRDTGGSVVTACAGRWPVSEDLCFHLGVKRRPGKPCGACEHIAEKQVAAADLRRSMTYAPVEYPGVFELGRTDVDS